MFLRIINLGTFSAASSDAEVFLNDEMQQLPLRRLRLEMAASQLYPQDYDLSTLFTDFHERKFQRDIKRGSKKAQNLLRKQAQARRQKAENKD
ncbi:MAG TPA: hypothetical protein IAA27_09640 [Candidatus Enterococcus stercoravium]|nr:hypothetical protein [Candidatus Enterococcus stercoravium]